MSKPSGSVTGRSPALPPPSKCKQKTGKQLYANENHSYWLVGWRPRAVCNRLSALAILPYCHASFSQAQFIGHIAIWILLVILPFGFYWSYCHLVLRAGFMLSAKYAATIYWSYWQYCHGNLIAAGLLHGFYMPYIYTFILISINK